MAAQMRWIKPCHPRPSQKMHQTTGPGGMGEFQWKSGQDKADEGHHHGKVEDDVESAKPTIDVACLIRSHMLREEDPFGSQLPSFPRSPFATRGRCGARRPRRPKREVLSS